MTEYDKLNNELKNAGVPDSTFLGEIRTPIDTLVNSRLSSKPYVDILLKYISKLHDNEQEMVVRALTEKGLKDIAFVLIDLLKKSNSSNYRLWTIGNALYTIDDKSSYSEIITICKNRELGEARQMLLGTLARTKKKEAYDVLLDCLTDPTVRGHAIDALGRFGNPEAIETLESIEVVKGKHEYKAKQTAINRLTRKMKNLL